MTRLVSRRWADEFLLELRARDVPGKEIGDALAHVESFCADSGQDATDAFGPPREYAASLWPDTPAGTFDDWRPHAGEVVVVALQIAAFGLLANAVPALVDGRRVEVMLPAVAIGVVGVVLVLLVVGRLDRAVRWAVRAGFLRILGVAAVPTLLMVGVGLVAARVAPDPIGTLPPGPVVLVTATVLLAPAVAATLRPGEASDVDPLVRPFDDEERARRSARRLERLLAWIVPGFAVLAVAMSLVLDHLAQT